MMPGLLKYVARNNPKTLKLFFAWHHNIMVNKFLMTQYFFNLSWTNALLLNEKMLTENKNNFL